MSAISFAMIFPGQGSQSVGMGRALAEASPAARAIFERADAVLGRPLSRLCFEGPEEELKRTINTQPALYTVSAAALAALREAGVGEPQWVAGHSLGEYSALFAAGVLDFETGLQLVQTRGRAMYEAGLARPGAMAAILNLEDEQVEAICARASGDGEVVVPANWNAPGQVVVSGDPPAVERAVALAREAGSRRSVMLPVSGAFHSPLVAPAVETMRAALAQVALAPPRCRFIPNVSAEPVEDVEAIRAGLAEQIVRPVRWTASMRAIAREGARVFIEVGAGKVLAGLLKRIDPEAVGVSFGDPADLERVRAVLGGSPA